MKAKYKVLLISGSYIVEEHCKKVYALGDLLDVTLLTSNKCYSHPYKMFFYQKTRVISDTCKIYATKTLGNVFSSTKFILWFPWILLNQKFDAIVVETEPWALLKWQTFF